MASAPRIKFCGITRREDAEHAAELGAWAIGLIFHRPSPRRCRQEAAIEIAAALRRRVEVCGVFVNPHLDDLAATADRVGLSLLQLHGDEGPAFCAEAARRTGARVIKAAAVHTAADVRRLHSLRTDFHLLDTHRPGLRGGTGETFDWELARLHHGRPLILSGGLTPENVADGIAVASPWAVDVASGVEAAPGRKDHARMTEFAAAVAATAAPAEDVA